MRRIQIEARLRGLPDRLTISLRMLISLKSMRFSSSSMWLLRSTLTARWAPDSLCTHMRTSPKAPVHNTIEAGWDSKLPPWRKAPRKSCFQRRRGLLLTGSEHLADSVEVAQFPLSASYEVSGADALMRLVLDSDLCTSVGYRKNRGQRINCGSQTRACLHSTIYWTVMKSLEMY